MQPVNTAMWAILFHFDATGIITAVLDRGVIALFTFGASQMNDWSDVFFL